MGYTKQAVTGITWTAALRGITRIISYGRIAVVARILTPAQYGVFGVASLALAFIEILTETGINIVLVQEDEKLEDVINSAWIISILRGFLIATVLFLLSGSIASFFNAPGATGILQLMSIVPLIRGFINPAIITFQKELAFQKDFYFRSIIFFIDAVVAIAATILTRSPIGMVYGLIVGAMCEVVFSFLFLPLRPRLEYNTLYIKKIFARGKWVTAAGIFNYLFQNGDNIAVGKLLGTGALGLYDAAYKLSILPLTEVGDVVIKVMFPVYVKIAHERARLRRAFFKHVSAVMFLILPICLVFFLFPQEIILLVLGEKWLGAVPVFRVLILLGFLRALTNSAFPLFLSVKKQEYVTYSTLLSFLVLLLGIVPLTTMYGLIGAGYAAVIASLLTVPINTFFTLKILYQK